MQMHRLECRLDQVGRVHAEHFYSDCSDVQKQTALVASVDKGFHVELEASQPAMSCKLVDN